MKRQAKFKPQMRERSVRRSARQPPSVRKARSRAAILHEDTVYNTGMDGEMYVGKNPVPVTMDLLKQGQMRFNTYCSPCHDRDRFGAGNRADSRASWQPANLMEDRVVQFADGDIFNVIIERPADHAGI